MYVSDKITFLIRLVNFILYAHVCRIVNKCRYKLDELLFYLHTYANIELKIITKTPITNMKIFISQCFGITDDSTT